MPLENHEQALRNFTPSLTTNLCTNCYEPCDINSRSNGLIEIVCFAIPSQIQSIMCRNSDILNKYYPFPKSGACFGQWYRRQLNVSANKITLLIHTDGASHIRSSNHQSKPYGHVLQPLQNFLPNKRISIEHYYSGFMGIIN
ncbi:unnamed protein product [Rotaria socialis]|uniref:Uncharacterized protein n=2 Tax=Rotaria socialis TaxID=392032 RepID=A0A818SHA3_9BILA|nr:unnamed protein product [Rotaria socialis]CAF4930109.1 unnamed protein product [Rotaria socialis]